MRRHARTLALEAPDHLRGEMLRSAAEPPLPQASALLPFLDAAARRAGARDFRRQRLGHALRSSMPSSKCC
jgi:hypothetical protein